MKEEGQEGAILMEVVLALALFVGAAVVIGGGLSASMRALDRVRLEGHALNLAITVLSELQMGIKPVTSAGPEPFDPPFELWSWQTIVTETGVEGALPAVEVVIRHEEENHVLRLAQLLEATQEAEADADADTEVFDEATDGMEAGSAEEEEDAMLDEF